MRGGPTRLLTTFQLLTIMISFGALIVTSFGVIIALFNVVQNKK
ncbi:putative holin-like toxin [Paenibacillus marchantiophytorum]